MRPGAGFGFARENPMVHCQAAWPRPRPGGAWCGWETRGGCRRNWTRCVACHAPSSPSHKPACPPWRACRTRRSAAAAGPGFSAAQQPAVGRHERKRPQPARCKDAGRACRPHRPMAEPGRRRAGSRRANGTTTERRSPCFLLLPNRAGRHRGKSAAERQRSPREPDPGRNAGESKIRKLLRSPPARPVAGRDIVSGVPHRPPS